MRIVAIEVRPHMRVAWHPHLAPASPQPGHLVLLLPLHPPVPEPDLNLLLGHAQRVRDLYSSSPRQISEVEFFISFLFTKV